MVMIQVLFFLSLLENRSEHTLDPSDGQSYHRFLLLGSLGCSQWIGCGGSVGLVARCGQRIDTCAGIRTSAVFKVSGAVDALLVDNPSETRVASSLRSCTIDGICINIQFLIALIKIK